VVFHFICSIKHHNPNPNQFLVIQFQEHLWKCIPYSASTKKNVHFNICKCSWNWITRNWFGLGLWCLMPLQLYRGGQFYRWRSLTPGTEW
jgi:hypothetical protein